MADVRKIKLTSPGKTEALGARLALFLKPGDFIALSGDLGAGKTTLARGLIRALVNDPDLEVPSPSFTLVQSYEGARMPVAHFAFYRLEDEHEVLELGLDEALEVGVVLVEWPGNAPSYMPHDFLEISLELEGQETRNVELFGHGSWQARLERISQVEDFLSNAGWHEADRSFLQGDASARRYEKLERNGTRAIFMDSPTTPDGPPVKDNKTYSEIAHLAQTVEPYIAMANGLQQLELSAPEIYASDLENGFILLEDLGTQVFGDMIAHGEPMEEPYGEAVEVLVTLATQGMPKDLPSVADQTYHLPLFDLDAFKIEADLLLDWFWPALKGTKPEPEIAQIFAALWEQVYGQLDGLPLACALRDYHSPNLLWLADRKGVARVGLIDFQDAVLAPLGYDLVSLLQDARLNVSVQREYDLFEHFTNIMSTLDKQFDQENFARAYAIWGAQRNTKILGIFARLARRDNKPGYLHHIPRVSVYLERNLAHPALADLKAWFDEHLPEKIRQKLTRTERGSDE